MADSHDGEKSKEESFHEHIESTSTHISSPIKPNSLKKRIAFCGAGVAVWVLGFFISLHWLTHEAYPPSIPDVAAAGALATIILLCGFIILAFMYLMAAGFGKGPLKPKDGGPTIDQTWVDEPWVRKSGAPADVSVKAKENDDFYRIGAIITGLIIGFITFVSSWIYCIATYGYLLGVGLGWLPSIIVAVIVAVIAGALWPLILIGLIGIVLLFLFNK